MIWNNFQHYHQILRVMATKYIHILFMYIGGHVFEILIGAFEKYIFVRKYNTRVARYSEQWTPRGLQNNSDGKVRFLQTVLVSQRIFDNNGHYGVTRNINILFYPLNIGHGYRVFELAYCIETLYYYCSDKRWGTGVEFDYTSDTSITITTTCVLGFLVMTVIIQLKLFRTGPRWLFWTQALSAASN